MAEQSINDGVENQPPVSLNSEVINDALRSEGFYTLPAGVNVGVDVFSQKEGLKRKDSFFVTLTKPTEVGLNSSRGVTSVKPGDTHFELSSAEQREAVKAAALTEEEADLAVKEAEARYLGGEPLDPAEKARLDNRQKERIELEVEEYKKLAAEFVSQPEVAEPMRQRDRGPDQVTNVRLNVKTT